MAWPWLRQVPGLFIFADRDWTMQERKREAAIAFLQTRTDHTYRFKYYPGVWAQARHGLSRQVAGATRQLAPATNCVVVAGRSLLIAWCPPPP